MTSTTPTGQKIRLLRVSMSVYRKQSMSVEDFNTHWTQTHAPLVSAWLARHGVIRYTQYHTPTSLQQPSEEAWPELKGMQRLPYDGTVEFCVENVEVLRNARSDPFYLERVLPDEMGFFEMEGDLKPVWTVGWEECYVGGGRVLSEGSRGDVTGS